MALNSKSFRNNLTKQQKTLYDWNLQQSVVMVRDQGLGEAEQSGV